MAKKNKSLKWFSSYLLQRKQHVQTSTLKTASLNVVCGVSQGFTLSLLLFILYTNDLCKVSDILSNLGCSQIILIYSCSTQKDKRTLLRVYSRHWGHGCVFLGHIL